MTFGVHISELESIVYALTQPFQRNDLAIHLRYYSHWRSVIFLKKIWNKY